MTPEERKLLEDVNKKLTDFLDVYYRTHLIDKVIFQNPVYFNNGLYFKDGTIISTGATTGLKIGTASSDKIGFYGVTPVVKFGAIGAPTSPSALYTQAEAQSAVNAINSIRSALSSIGITA